MSSRSWASLYTARDDSTADLTQALLDMGAVIVGKSKVSQLSAGKDLIDTPAPWSPRLSGNATWAYSWAGASAAAAAAAGYDWLQGVIGHDGECLCISMPEHGTHGCSGWGGPRGR